ncbi:SRPBCC domain-containing protein [Hoyosella rhizosphaerae]|uniref:Activator of Hsp90 ATPase homologue 1/2-like C-terminal domain-containing protein n=1 Tax=Hoyosella rhizosphaerae TaxID=1755582 RepID=A0A916XD74_9ACTN|nr:SRPBCC domain-containing protein [Hoyosella rhizosphaerae]MBN4927610.1 SRPBCC domain-containing protein [Hoyosella rhizosphaerae]GGC63105.1 hypothetical protein GCM10011410_14420 [Hoyosella rhizosphaerae]
MSNALREVDLENSSGEASLTIRAEVAAQPDTVWSFLTEPALLLQWSPVVPDRDLTEIGPAFTEDPDDEALDATVISSTPPRSLSHKWGEGRLDWDVQDTLEGCLITLTQQLNDVEDAAQAAAGWHLCFDDLALALGSAAHPQALEPEAYWGSLVERYQKHFS